MKFYKPPGIHQVSRKTITWSHQLLMPLFCLILFLFHSELSAQAISSTSQETSVIEGSNNVLYNLSANNGSIAMADNGTYVVAFQQKESGGSDTEILFGVSTVAGGYTEQGVVNTTKTYNQTKPKVAVSADGTTFAIAWLSQTAATSTSDVFVKVYGDVDGPSYSGSSEIKLNTNAISSGLMKIAMDANGDFVVVWHDDVDDKIYAQRLNSAGTKQGSVISVDDIYVGTIYALDVAMDAAGEFVVSWYDARPEDTSGGLFAKKFNANGTVQNATFLVNHITSGYQNGGNVGMANSGEFIISYNDGTDTYFRKYESNGTSIGYAQLTDPISSSIYIRDIGIDANLNYVLMFSNSSNGIYTRRFDWDDNDMGTATTVSSGGTTTEMAINRADTEYSSFVKTVKATDSPLQYHINAYRHELCIDDPGVITGSVEVCPGESSVTYSISAVSGASNYTWTLTDASIATFTDGTTSKTTGSSVQVNYNGVNTGTVTLDVIANGGTACGSSANNSELSISSSNISNPGSITGLSSVIENSLKSYSITAIDGAASYTWSVPTGATIDTDNGNSIIVQFGSTSGNVSVYATDDCGNNTTTVSKAVTVSAADTTPPQILSLSPAHGEDGVATSTGVYTIRLDETVTISKSASNILLRTGTKLSVVTVATASPSTDITYSSKFGHSINFGTVSLTPGTTYFIEIPNNVFADSQLNFFEGTTSSTWSFTANRVPTNIALSGSTVTDGDGASTYVGDLSATDADTNESFTFSLVSGTGSTDNAKFSISGNELYTAAAVDYETQTSYSIRVRVTDGAGSTFDKVLSISVTDVDDTPPTLLSSDPGDTDTDVSPYTNIVLDFDESVKVQDGTSTTIFLKTGGVTTKSWTINPVTGTYPVDASFSGGTLTLETGVDLAFATTYTLESFTISDYAGNTSSTGAISFTTRAASDENDILGFDIENLVVGDPVIDPVNHTVVATVEEITPNGVLTELVTFDLSDGAVPYVFYNNTYKFFPNGSSADVTIRSESGVDQVWSITLNHQTLDGTYSIGDNGDFATLQKGFDQIDFVGISGDVTLEIEDGYDQEQLLALANPDPTYQLTVRPQSGATDVKIRVQDASSQAAFGIGQDVENVVIDGADPLTGDKVLSIVIDQSDHRGFTISNAGSGTVADVTVQNVIFDIVTGTAFYSSSGYYNITGLTVQNCEFVANNTTSTYVGAFDFNNSYYTDCSVINNEIYNAPGTPDPSTFYGIMSDAAGATGLNNVINNSLAMRGSTVYGINRAVNVLHNTIHIYGDNEGAIAYGIYTPQLAQNNIVQISSSATTYRYGINGMSAEDTGNNIYIYDDGVSPSSYGGSPNITQEDVLALEPSTTFEEVFFTDEATGDLSLSGTSASSKSLRVTPLAGVLEDIEGTTRSTLAASKGAYESPNNITEVLSFVLSEQTGDATIDVGAGTIAIEVAALTDVSSLTPTISIYTGASISPNSEVTTDFTNPVVYTVTAEDGTTQDYTVTVTVAPNTEALITSWTLEGQIGDAVIDTDAFTVDVTVNGLAGKSPFGGVQTFKFYPSIGLSPGATVSPLGTSLMSAGPGSSVTYTVTSEDGLTENSWAIRVHYEPIEGGTYQVGDAGDFENLATAFQRLSNIGVLGDVTLEILENQTSYTAQLNESEEYLGHTLTIMPADGVTNLMMGRSTSAQSISINWQKIIIDGKNVTRIANPAQGQTISLSNSNADAGEFAVIKNVELEGYNSSSIDNTTIENCTFFMEDNLNSTIYAFSLTGANALIRNNKVFFGSAVDKSTLNMYGFYTLSGGEVYNNFIHLSPTAVSSAKGIVYSALYPVAIHHNTIVMDGTSTGTETLIGIEESSAGGVSEDIHNNLIYISRDPGLSGSKTGMKLTSNYPANIEYNNIYLENNSGSLTYVYDGTTTYDGTNFGTLMSMTDGLTNSQPVFTDIANDDLTLTGVSLDDTDMRGTPIAGITEDYFGTSRSLSSPSKGADETPNTITEILSLTFASQIGSSVIDPDAHTVTAELSAAGDITAVSPTVEVSAGASVSPLSGQSQNFSSDVTYTVTSEAGNTQDWIVSIAINSAPTALDIDNSSIAENADSGTLIGAFSTTDPDAGDTHSYSLVSGTGDTDNASFTIDGNSLISNEVFDYETKSSYSILVRTDDGKEGTLDVQFDIAITDASDFPTNITLDNESIVENNGIDDVVGVFSTTDQDAGDSHTYSLGNTPSYPDNNYFAISGNELQAKVAFDFEVKSTYSIQVQTTDASGKAYLKNFVISIINQFEEPTNIFLSASTVDENSGVDTPVGTFTTEDQDAAEVYSYDFATGEGDADNGLFSISGGELRVGELFDFETKSSYSILVSTSDGNGGSFVKQFDITINDVSEAPTDVALDNSSISESLAAGTVVGTLSNTDEDAGEVYSYTLVTGTGDTDNNSFEIVGDELRSAEIFDFETKNSYSVRIQVSDGNGGLHAEPFTISITDVPASITDIGLTGSNVNENESSGTVVGTLSTIGEEITGAYSYALVTGDGTNDADNGSFAIVDEELRTSAVFDFETKSSFNIYLQTDDGAGGTFEKAVVISVNDITEAPTDIDLDETSIAENNSVDSVIGVFTATDEDAGESYTFTLEDDATYPDNTSFEIVDGELLASEMFDYETQNSYTINVQVSDGSFTYSEEFTITITDDTDESLIWTGTVWINGTPGAGSDDVIIDGDYNTADDGLLEVNSLVINSGKTLTVAPDNYLYVVGDITNNGSLVVESGADLMTHEVGDFTGNDVIIKRNTRYADGKYSFVGTPMQQTTNVTNSTIGSHVYTYDESQAYDPNDGADRWIAMSGELVPGVGYTQAMQQEIIFTGLPNVTTVNVNGTYTGTYDDGINEENEGWVFVSNPYATAIEVGDFLAQTNIEGAVYIWDDNGSDNGRGTNSDYVIANGTVATNTTAAGGQDRYEGYLGSAQGFFVKLADDVDTEITFTPGMRVAGNNADDNFFRTAGTPAYIRVNLTNEAGLFKQAIVGRIAGINDESVDRSFDAKVFSSKAGDLIYTLKGEQALAIQGVSYEREAVQLAYNVAEAGVYTIALDLTNAQGESFYLLDKLTGETIDLSTESYSFSSAAGQFGNRFELVSGARVLGLEVNDVQVYAHEQTIYINMPEGGAERTFELISLDGQRVLSRQLSESAKIETNLPAGVYIVTDGEQSHKIILK